MANTDQESPSRSEFKKEELDALGKPSSSKDKKKGDKQSAVDKDTKDKKDEDDMAPVKLNPKEDYQVKEALNYLKSFELFKKIAAADQGATGPATAHKSTLESR